MIKMEAYPIIIDVLKKVTEGVKKISNWFKRLKKEHPKIYEFFRKLIAFAEIGIPALLAGAPALLGIVAIVQSGIIVFEAFSSVFGGILIGFKFLFKLVGKGIGIFGKFGKVMGASRFVGVLKIFGKIFFWVNLIVASVKPLINLFDELSKIWGDNTKTAGEKIVDTMKSVIKTLWEIFDNFFFGIPSKIAEMFGLTDMFGTEDTKKGKTTTKEKQPFDISKAIDTGLANISKVFEDIVNRVSSVFDMIVNRIQEYISWIDWDGILNSIISIINKVVDFLAD